MSLWFALKVNHHQIGVLTIQRVCGDSDPDSVNTYEVIATGSTLPTRLVNVEHRYGDGAWELIRTALDAVLPAAPEAGDRCPTRTESND